MIVFSVPADRMSMAEFHALFEPRRSRLHELVGQLWGADREETARIHAEIRALSLVEVEDLGPGRIAA